MKGWLSCAIPQAVKQQIKATNSTTAGPLHGRGAVARAWFLLGQR